MNKKTKYIDDLFKDELGSYTETPPPAVWDRLEKKLDNKPPQATGYNRRRLWYFGVLSLVLLVGVVVSLQLTGTSSIATKQFSSNEANRTGSPNTPSHNNSGGNKTGNENQSSAANNDVNRNSASDKKISETNQPNTPVNTAANLPKDQTGKGPDTNNPSRPAYRANKTAKQGIAKTGKSSEKTERADKTTKALAYNAKHSSSKGPNAEEDVPENEYGSSAGRQAAEDRTSKDQPNSGDKKTEEPKIVTKKTEQPVQKSADPKKDNDKNNPRPRFKRFEVGVKAGYEAGFNNDGAKKGVVSPYIQYKITPRLAVMFQPSVKSAYLSSRRIGNTRSYYKINPDSAITAGPSNPVYVIDGTNPSFYITDYQYRETHDTILKSNAVSGSYTEFELPVLLKYYLGKNISVYGGVNIVYSKLLGISEHTNLSQPIVATKDTFVVSATIADAHPYPIRSVINYSGTPISAYSGPIYPAATGDQFRVGYMLGFSYEYSKRWLLDALIQQASARPNVEGGYNTNTALSVPYFRFTLGYKLTK